MVLTLLVMVLRTHVRFEAHNATRGIPLDSPGKRFLTIGAKYFLIVLDLHNLVIALLQSNNPKSPQVILDQETPAAWSKLECKKKHMIFNI